MKIYLLILISTIVINYSFAQKSITYVKKLEVGYDLFGTRLITIDAGPNWRGYYLDNNQNGFEINFINGVSAYDHFFAGAGGGYLNFEGIHGVSVFGNLEYWPLKKRLSPVLIIKVGNDHIWNQYDGGRGTARGEFGLGINYKIKDHLSIYIQSGMLLTMQSNLLPFKLGFQF